MPSWIVLIRGINVGGRVLPMKRLAELMEQAGCTKVATYIQSGNAVCTSRIADARTLGTKIGKAIHASEGYEPRVMVLSLADFEAAIAANPYPVTEPTLVHLFFLDAVPTSLAALEPFKAPTEKYKLVGTTLYFYAPDGFGTSKLAGQVEKRSKVAATARNWRTVTALRDLAASQSPGTAPSSPSKRAPSRTTRGPRKTPR